MPPIPDHNQWGVLVPKRGERETPETCSPYRASVGELIHRFATSDARRSILDGFLRFRAELREIGMFDAVQWVDGGFLDRKPTEPADIDVVTLFSKPGDWAPGHLAELTRARPHLFEPEAAKERFHVDAYYVDLDLEPKGVLRRVTYFFGLFSHQRVTRAWRGLLQVPLPSPDNDTGARDILEGRVTYDPST